MLKRFLCALLCFALCAVPVCAQEVIDPTEDLASDSTEVRTPLSYGIDISRWQGEVDFQKVAADGIEFVILRAGYWDTQDSNFKTYYTAAKEAGLEVGAYLYSYALTEEDARYEARNAATWLAEKTFEYPIYFDLEDPSQSNLTNGERTALCLAFAEELEQHGYYAGVYASENWFNRYLVKADLEGMPLWLAKWTEDGTPSASPDEGYGMWQYTDQGEVDGIKDSVDLDVCYVDYPAYIKEHGYNGYGTPMPSPLPFTDVPQEKWYFENIRYAYENGLMNGMSASAFSPDEPVTRGMFVTILGRMSGVLTETYVTCPFLDVDMGRYYGPYIAWAYENGITDGKGSGFFDPDGQITREQMCKMIAGYLAYADIGIGGGPVDLFTDDADISHWAYSQVYSLAGGGIIEGVGGGAFAPKKTATRAQCATIMMRVHQLLN